VLPTVNVAVMEKALALFAEAVGAGSKRRIILVLEGVGWHTPRGLKVPEGLHLVFLPP
jgi:hypothetical protein